MRAPRNLGEFRAARNATAIRQAAEEGKLAAALGLSILLAGLCGWLLFLDKVTS